LKNRGHLGVRFRDCMNQDCDLLVINHAALSHRYQYRLGIVNNHPEHHSNHLTTPHKPLRTP